MKKFLSSHWVYALPLLACLLVMLPRLLSPQFGLMDDGRSVITSQKLAQGTWDMSVDVREGRSRPMYWLYFYFFYTLFGKQPFWFFLGNTLVLLITTLALMALLRRLGCSLRWAWLAGLLFALAGPLIENFYTLTKGETPQIAFLVLSLLVMMFFDAVAVTKPQEHERPQRHRDTEKTMETLRVSVSLWRNNRKKLLWMLLAALLLFAAHISKETSLGMLPISLVWWGLAWLWSRRWPWQSVWNLTTLAAYVVANGLAAAAFLALRAATVGMSFTSGSYTGRYTFDLGLIVASGIRWAGWLARDFAYAVPLALVAVFSYVILRRRELAPIQVAALIWSAVWMGVYFPWGLMAEYYMLPFALGLVVVAAGWVEQGILLWQVGGRSRWLAAVGLSITGLLFIASLFNNATTARVQLTIDAVNAEALRQVAAMAPKKSIVLINIQSPNEYFYASEDHLWHIWDRPDLDVRVVSEENMSQFGEAENYYLLVPTIQNQPLQTVRMGVVEESQQTWNSILEGYMAGQNWQLAADLQHNFRLSVIDFARLFCPIISTRSFCVTDAPLVDTRVFSYGWKLYSLKIPK